MELSTVREFSADPRTCVLEADSEDLFDLCEHIARRPHRERRRNGNGLRKFAVRLAEHSNRGDGRFRLISWNPHDYLHAAPFDYLLAPEIPCIPVIDHA